MAFHAQHLQQALRHGQVDRVVLHQQHPLRTRGQRRGDDLVDRAGRLAAHGLAGQGRAQVGVGHVARQHHRLRVQLFRRQLVAVQQDQVGVAELGLAFQAARQRQDRAADRRVIGDHRAVGPRLALRRTAAQALQRLLGRVGGGDPQAPVGQQQRQPHLQALVGGQQQHPPAGEVGLLRGHVACDLQQRDLEPEAGTLAGLGIHPDAPAHQRDDALADRKAQAGAAVQPRGRGIGLRERLEQLLLRFRVDADAGVADLETQLVLRGGLAGAAHVQRHAAALGELDCIAEQVGEHLAQAHGIAAHRQPHRGVDAERQPQALGLGRALHQHDHAFQQLAQVEADGFQVELVCLELGVVEDVVDDPQHLLRGGVGRAHQLGLVDRHVGVHQQVQHRHDAVERGADLVAHGGQELALGQHRRLRRLLGLGQFVLQLRMLFQVALQGVGAGGLALAQFLLDQAMAARRALPGQDRADRHARGDDAHDRGRAALAGKHQEQQHGAGQAGGGQCRPRQPAGHDGFGHGGLVHRTACRKSNSGAFSACCTRLPWM